MGSCEQVLYLEEVRVLLEVRDILLTSDDLRRAPWKGSPKPTAGHCYVASEVLYHALGGKAAGYTVWGMKWEGSQHWWLQNPGGAWLDPTWDQFEVFPPHAEGKRRSFLTNHPSKRAVEMARRAGIALQKEA